MIRFPYAKINLGLNVVRKRSDGWHEIESVLVPIPLHDIVEVVEAPDLGPGVLEMTRSGLPVAGELTSDLCWRAVKAAGQLRALPGLRLHLHKVVPMGAGLGGGSSDASHTLLLLNDLLRLELSPNELHTLAASIGSDCPFFLSPTPQLAEGRGEQLRPAPLDLKGIRLLLVNPGLHVPTPEAYALTKPTGRSMDLVGALAAPMEEWQATVRNAMEHGVFEKWPEIRAIKERLLASGAAYAAMSGSGSSVFGLFRKEPPDITWPEHYFVRQLCW